MVGKNLQCCIHSIVYVQKQRIFNGAFSFCGVAKGADLTL